MQIIPRLRFPPPCKMDTSKPARRGSTRGTWAFGKGSLTRAGEVLVVGTGEAWNEEAGLVYVRIALYWI